MTKVLVTGATGLLGAWLAPSLVESGHAVVRHGHNSDADVRADLCEPDQVESLLDRVRPDVVVNLAGLTSVDLCEGEPDMAYRLNALLVENLSSTIRRSSHAPHLVHISTDMVYDGAGPHSERHVTVRNTYALSKLAGEIAAAHVGGSVLRTNFFGRSNTSGRSSLSDWLFDSLRHNRPISVFEDVLFSPLSIGTLCSMIALVIERRPSGVLNLGARNGLSKADFAFAFAACLGLATSEVRRCRAIDSGSFKARRPTDMRMDCSLFEKTLRVSLPTLMDEIHLTRKDYHG